MSMADDIAASFLNSEMGLGTTAATTTRHLLHGALQRRRDVIVEAHALGRVVRNVEQHADGDRAEKKEIEDIAYGRGLYFCRDRKLMGTE